MDLILTHLGIGHDDHVPEKVITLTREGCIPEAVEAYIRITESRPSVARREVAYLAERLREKKNQDISEV